MLARRMAVLTAASPLANEESGRFNRTNTVCGPGASMAPTEAKYEADVAFVAGSLVLS